MPQSNQCVSCLHHQGIDTCLAFPNGIPYEIISGQIDHNKIQPGQEGDFIWKEYDFNKWLDLIEQLSQQTQ